MRILSLVLLALGAVAHARVVTLNVDRAFTEYNQTRKADQELQARIDAFRREQASAVEAYQALQREFNQIREEAARLDLSEEQRKASAERAAALISQLRQKEQELQQTQQNFQRELEEQGRRLRQRIVDEIRARVEVLAKDRDWEMVIDSSAINPANGVPLVQFAAPSVDVTNEVIRALNSLPEPATTP